MSKGQLTITPKYVAVAAQNDWLFGVTLWDGGTVKSLTGATVTVAVQDLANNQLISGTAQASGTSGADWANGLLVVYIPAASTNIQKGTYQLEIQVSLSGVKTIWPLIPVYVQAATLN